MKPTLQTAQEMNQRFYDDLLALHYRMLLARRRALITELREVETELMKGGAIRQTALKPSSPG